ncbi:hypothetical protein [Zobellella sp. DQSA1]|uniref:hypothetical protein n=1 Tax=Zobellella sp. DQSA1 TaxID=3342386 RepID=UPI0035BECF15
MKLNKSGLNFVFHYSGSPLLPNEQVRWQLTQILCTELLGPYWAQELLQPARQSNCTWKQSTPLTAEHLKSLRVTPLNPAPPHWHGIAWLLNHPGANELVAWKWWLHHFPRQWLSHKEVKPKTSLALDSLVMAYYGAITMPGIADFKPKPQRAGTRKLKKLLREPRRFFGDSRHSWFRYLATKKIN